MSEKTLLAVVAEMKRLGLDWTDDIRNRVASMFSLDPHGLVLDMLSEEQGVEFIKKLQLRPTPKKGE
jgi:hypothetical protein